MDKETYKVLFSSANDDWSTPQDLFDRLNNLYHFTVDVCATDENHKLPKYYTKAINGLKQDWTGEIVWMNPPYGDPMPRWLKKLAYSNCQGIALLPVRTSTVWFHQYIVKYCNAIEFLKGRLKFSNYDKAASFGSMLVYYRIQPANTSVAIFRRRL